MPLGARVLEGCQDQRSDDNIPIVAQGGRKCKVVFYEDTIWLQIGDIRRIYALGISGEQGRRLRQLVS